MNGRWAYNWVQILAHNYRFMLAMFIGLTLAVMSGYVLGWSELTRYFQSVPLVLVLASLVAMALVAMKVMDSVKTGLLLFGLSLYVLFVLGGLLAWLRHTLHEEAVLALVVVMALMMSNLVHVLSTLLREMARASFQHDAIAEALSLNAMPILLTNVTTTFGFVVAAWFEPRFTDLAWIVGLGALVSYVTLMSWAPAILLKWFLEFRVGHYDDRHGFVELAEKFQRHPNRVRFLVMFSSLTVLLSAIFLFQYLAQVEAVAVMLLASGALLFVVWRDARVTLQVLLSSLVIVVLVLAGFLALSSMEMLSALVLVVPLGIVLDDAIHYYARYLKAKQGYFSDVVSCHRFALSSVGRPIWLTTQLLVVGLAVLSFSSEELVRQASWITILAVVLASYVILVWLPALSLYRSK